jgi:integrase
LGLKREDRPAAFAGRSDSGFRSSSRRDTGRAYTSEYPIPRARRHPSSSATPARKEYEKLLGKHFETIGGKQCDPLQDDYPAVCSLNQLRRDPHILGWFAHLRSQTPPLAPAVYVCRLLFLRSILEELPWTAQLPDLTHLIRREDIPRIPQRLPRPLTAEQDRLIQQELLRRNDMPANVFLLLRHTGMRIGECADLSYDCLHNVGPDRWAIHVPLGKLKTERMVPVDSFVCELVHRLRFFRSFDPLPADGRLLARHSGEQTLVKQPRPYLYDVSAAVGISTRPTSLGTMQHPGLCFLGARGSGSELARRAFAALARLYHGGIVREVLVIAS